MKVSVGFCEYIENEWLSGGWKYAYNSKEETGWKKGICLFCGDTSAGSCGQTPVLGQSSKYLSFDLAADAPTFSTSACGSDGNTYETRLPGTNILSVAMLPTMLYEKN